ncbi:MAG: hypothetical protein Q9176_003322 [Flavoplaca citrina]
MVPNMDSVDPMHASSLLFFHLDASILLKHAILKLGCTMTNSKIVRLVCLFLALLILPFSYSNVSALGTTGRIAHQSINVLGHCAVALEWCDLVWPWLCSSTSFARDMRHTAFSAYHQLRQVMGRTLRTLAWIYIVSIDDVATQEVEPKNSLLHQQSFSQRNHCPWNDPAIWSHIDSETDDLPQEDDIIPPTTPLPPADPPQLPSLPPSPASNPLATTIDLPPLRVPPTHPDPLRDPITLRTRTVPNSPSILDNIHQIQQIIAQRNTQAQLDSAPSSPTQHTPPGRSSFENYRSALPHRQDASRGFHAGEESIRTPDLDHEDCCASSLSDESELNDWEPLVSTALPRKPVRERWAVVFEDAKGRDEELDRFEAALGRGGGGG